MKKVFTIYFDDECGDTELTEDMEAVVIKPEAGQKSMSSLTESEVCRVLSEMFASRKQTIDVIASRSAEDS
jgi:hypothetical protein